MIRRSWMAAMAGGSVEATLERWASSLRDVKGRIRPLFQQARMAQSAGLFLDACSGALGLRSSARAGAAQDGLDARLRPDGRGAPPRQPTAAPKNEGQGSAGCLLIRWSVQEIRRVAMRLAQRRIRPAHLIAWSVWRRAHQAVAQRSHLKRKSQLECEDQPRRALSMCIRR